LATVSLGAWLAHSPDDINTTNIPGLQTFSGDDATVNATPKHVPRAPVYVHDQFGPQTLATVKEDELCIPSLKTVLP
jgi:hypothetical protein